MNNCKDIRTLKNELRTKFKTIRKNMSTKVKMNMDIQIQSHLFSTSEYLKEDVILTYVSKPLEVDTINIIKTSWTNKKKVAVPKCKTDKTEMDFYFINSLDDLEVGTFGVLEPIEEKCRKVTNFFNGLCIVPGFSFDENGFRIGYGKGYYDRFLAYFLGKTVGICYSNCITKKIPHGCFDIPMDSIITDKGVTHKKDLNFEQDYISIKNTKQSKTAEKIIYVYGGKNE